MMFARVLAVATILGLGTTAMARALDAHVMSGTFHCLTHGNSGPDWRFVSVNKPYGAWLRAETAFPAQNGSPPQTAVAYVGFDADAKRWSIVVVNGDGSYYTRYSTSSKLDGSRWTDRDPADGGQARITLPSPGEYIFDFQQTEKSGKTDRSHTVCKE
jgi:hypothetical protein